MEFKFMNIYDIFFSINATPLFAAIYIKEIEIVQLLLSNPNIDVTIKFTFKDTILKILFV